MNGSETECDQAKMSCRRRKRAAPIALVRRRMSFSDRTLFPLPFIDERGEPGLVIPETVRINRKIVALRGDRLRTEISSPRSPASFSARRAIRAQTAPSSMAVRSDCRASSGLTSKAGGIRRPARCSRPPAPRTISERRESSELRICCSRASSGRDPHFRHRRSWFRRCALVRDGRSAAELELAAVPDRSPLDRP